MVCIMNLGGKVVVIVWFWGGFSFDFFGVFGLVFVKDVFWQCVVDQEDVDFKKEVQDEEVEFDGSVEQQCEEQEVVIWEFGGERWGDWVLKVSGCESWFFFVRIFIGVS